MHQIKYMNQFLLARSENSKTNKIENDCCNWLEVTKPIAGLVWGVPPKIVEKSLVSC